MSALKSVDSNYTVIIKMFTAYAFPKVNYQHVLYVQTVLNTLVKLLLLSHRFKYS